MSSEEIEEFSIKIGDLVSFLNAQKGFLFADYSRCCGRPKNLIDNFQGKKIMRIFFLN